MERLAPPTVPTGTVAPAASLQPSNARTPQPDTHDQEHPLEWLDLARIGFVALAVAVSWLGLPVGEPEQFAYTPGKGIACSFANEEIVVGNRAFLAERGIDPSALPPGPASTTEVMIARGGRLLGVLQVADVLRPEAAEAVQQLRRLGLRTVLLTGDTKVIAEAVGRQVQVDEVAAELLPEEKVARVKALVAGGRKVAMVGDGINDAPALLEASVGVAVGSGTDVARESADVVLLGNDLVKLVQTLRLARRCRGIIRFNFAGTLAVDGVGVALAAFGMLNPLLAALIHVGSELAFIVNSARLLPGVAKRTRLPDGVAGREAGIARVGAS